MYTEAQLISQLKDSNLDPKGTVMIHSSMKAIGEVEGGADRVLDALTEFMKDGLLLFPTHSWDGTNLKDDTFNVRTEPSCVGLLTNLFRKRPGVVRSMHPSHSVAGLGANAKAYTDKDMAIIRKEGTITPCPRYGCFGSLYDERAQILFLGAPLTTNTYIHSVEEWLEIPDRLKTTSRRIRLISRDNQEHYVDLISHDSPHGDVSKNYDKIEEALHQKGFAHRLEFGDAKCTVVDARACADLIMAFLKKDPDLFADKRPVPTDWYC